MANKFLGKLEQAKDLKIELEQSGMFFNLQKNGKEGCYYVLAQDKNQTEDNIIDTTGIPLLGSVINGAPVRGFSAREVATVRHWQTGVITILWEVEVSTDSKLTSENTNTSGDPTEMRPRRRWYTEKETIAPEVDKAGNRICTGTGERLIVEFTEIIIVLEITRYEEYPFDQSKIYYYANHANAQTFYGAPVGTCLLDDIQSEEEEVNGTTYCKVTYVFKFRLREPVVVSEPPSPSAPVTTTTTTFPPNFDLGTYSQIGVLQRGFEYYENVDAANSKRKKIHKVDGQPVEINLDLYGVKSSTPVFRYFERHLKVDFAPLGLQF